MAYTKEEMEFLQSQNFPVKPNTEDVDFEELDLIQQIFTPAFGFPESLVPIFDMFNAMNEEKPELTLDGLKGDMQETLESMYRGILHDIERIKESTNAGEVFFHASHAATLETAMWILTDDAFPGVITVEQWFEHNIGMDHHVVAENGQLEVKTGDLVKEAVGQKVQTVSDYLHNLRIDAATGTVVEEQAEGHECRCEATDDLIVSIRDELNEIREIVRSMMAPDGCIPNIFDEQALFDGDDGIMEHHFLDEPPTWNDDLEF